MIIYYDNRFNQNEWFIIILLITAYLIVFSLPKRFPFLLSVIFILYGITIGHFLDHTISIAPFDYYDVGDNSYYEFSDYLSYIMYGPFSYFIVYFLDKFKLKKKHILPYIALWSSIAVAFEWIGVKLGEYHYEKGYKMQFSFPSYLVIISILLVLYYKLYRQKLTDRDNSIYK